MPTQTHVAQHSGRWYKKVKTVIISERRGEEQPEKRGRDIEGEM